MYIEYFINCIDEKDDDIKKNIDQISVLPLSGIIAPFYHAKLIKKLYPKTRTGCFIDYPLPNSNPENRQLYINDAIGIDMDYIAISVPYYYIINRKYAKFRDDIKKNLAICLGKNIELRYILEYRKFDHQLSTKICSILVEEGINHIYPASGFFLDNIEDNIIACAYLNSKTGINTIVNGNIWKQSQIDNVVKIKPYGISISQINNFNLIGPDLYDPR